MACPVTSGNGSGRTEQPSAVGFSSVAQQMLPRQLCPVSPRLHRRLTCHPLGGGCFVDDDDVEDTCSYHVW